MASRNSNFTNPDINPCIEENNLSMKCLERNNYNRNKCVLFFQNVKECKKFWGKIMRERKKLGIDPAMPPLEERKKIMEKKEMGEDVVF